MRRILSILPKGEGFSPDAFGAIALCVCDFTLYSRYRGETLVLGAATNGGFGQVHYECVPPPRWYENRTRSYARGCLRIIKRERPQLVEVHNRPRILRLIAGKADCRFALHLHNDPQEMDKAKTASDRKVLLTHCAAVYCVSSYIRDRFLEGLAPADASKVHVVYNGIAIPPALPPKENLIVFAGRMTEGKGGLLLAQALRMALPELPGWRAVLIGSRRHARAEKLTLHEVEIAHALEAVSAQIEMTGFIAHSLTMAYFARAAIAVVPSVWQEPFGRTAIEAMACGCALISSGRGGLLEVTQKAALTLSSLDSQTLAGAMITLATDEAERSRLQRAGRARAEYFSIPHRSHALDDIREPLLKEDRPHEA